MGRLRQEKCSHELSGPLRRGEGRGGQAVKGPIPLTVTKLFVDDPLVLSYAFCLNPNGLVGCEFGVRDEKGLVKYENTPTFNEQI